MFNFLVALTDDLQQLTTVKLQFRIKLNRAQTVTGFPCVLFSLSKGTIDVTSVLTTTLIIVSFNLNSETCLISLIHLLVLSAFLWQNWIS